jgi:hypothetical protein
MVPTSVGGLKGDLLAAEPPSFLVSRFLGAIAGLETDNGASSQYSQRSR